MHQRQRQSQCASAGCVLGEPPGPPPPLALAPARLALVAPSVEAPLGLQAPARLVAPLVEARLGLLAPARLVAPLVGAPLGLLAPARLVARFCGGAAGAAGSWGWSAVGRAGQEDGQAVSAPPTAGGGPRISAARLASRGCYSRQTAHAHGWHRLPFDDLLGLLHGEASRAHHEGSVRMTAPSRRIMQCTRWACR